ncbi:hypothetical protein [Curtobacterium flaccumfaciens]|uniref:hypothetical protein n=1 Tax=Curtobacterium flaccumfaciens TaxID=2035 RepID=UPI00324363B4
MRDPAPVTVHFRQDDQTLTGTLSVDERSAEDGSLHFDVRATVQEQEYLGHGTDLAGALDDLRADLEESGILIQVGGALRDAVVSRMSRQMGGGRKAYRVRLGHSARNDSMVDVLQPVSEAVSLAEQRAFTQRWEKSLGFAGRIASVFRPSGGSRR